MELEAEGLEGGFGLRQLQRVRECPVFFVSGSTRIRTTAEEWYNGLNGKYQRMNERETCCKKKNIELNKAFI